jgi:dephospho-CoA kinase
MVYDEIRRRGLDIVLDERAVREDMRAGEGPAVLAKRAATEAHALIKSGAPAVVLDGLYSWSEDKYLRSEFGDDLVTVALVNPKHVRYERVVARRDAHRPYTMSQIQLRDIEEIEGIEKGGPIAFADYYLANARDVTDLETHVHALMDLLGFSTV